MKIQKGRLEESIKRTLIKEDEATPNQTNGDGGPEIVVKGPKVNDREWIKKELYATELFRKRYLSGSLNRSLKTSARYFEPIKDFLDAYGNGEDSNRVHFVSMMTDKGGVVGRLVRDIMREKFKTELPNVFWEFAFYQHTPQGRRHAGNEDGAKNLIGTISKLGEVDDIAEIRNNMVDLVKHLNINRERLKEYKERTFENYEQLLSEVDGEKNSENEIIRRIETEGILTTEELTKTFGEVSVLINNTLNHFYEMLTRRIYVLNSLLQEKYKRYR